MLRGKKRQAGRKITTILKRQPGDSSPSLLAAAVLLRTREERLEGEGEGGSVTRMTERSGEEKKAGGEKKSQNNKNGMQPVSPPLPPYNTFS